jgi:putative NADH-flavin reductase
MRLTIFGATGGTGRQLVRQALDAGHEVTAVVRDPARLDIRHQRLDIVRADVLDPASIKPAVASGDAVVSALGARSRRDPVKICSAGTASILEAMHATGARRLVVVSATPVGPDDQGDRFLYRRIAKPLLRSFLRAVYADMARMEQAVRRSGLDWTILRPPRLTDRPRTGRYRTAIDRGVPGGYFISRADLADAILTLLEDRRTFGAAVAIGY